MGSRPMTTDDRLRAQLISLQLPYLREHYAALAQQAAAESWSHVEYLARLIEGEANRREARSIERRVKSARFPVLKTLDQFQWNWPTQINRLQIQNLFRLAFVEDKANVILLGGVGLGKTHLSIALGYTACLRCYAVLFTPAVDIINTLSAAQASGSLKRAEERGQVSRKNGVRSCLLTSVCDNFPSCPDPYASSLPVACIT